MAMIPGRPAVFLDKDGTLIDNVPFNVDPSRVRLAPGAGGALSSLQEAGYQLFVVTNQSGVARGYFTEQDLAGVFGRLHALIGGNGTRLQGVYYCPHHPQGTVQRYAVACECRKPEPGLILRAAREHAIDLGRSWVVGDILHDVDAGHRAGCRAILLDNGGETEWDLGPGRVPDGVARNLGEAANMIITLGNSRRW